MGPQGSSGTGTGSVANVYTPTAQPAADQMYQDIVQQLHGAGTGPAGVNYPTAQSFVDQYLTGSPYAAQAQQGAATAADQTGTFYPYQAGSGYQLQGAAGTALPYGQQALSQGFNPLYGQVVDYTQQNPYFQTALSGADQAANIGGQWASNLQAPMGAGVQAASPLLGGGQQALDYGTSVYRGAAPIVNAAQGVNQNAGNVWDASRQVANTAFDPRGALFNRTQQQVLDQSNAVNAMSGIAGTPYGAGVTGQNLSNFDIDWQNQQLQRQQTGLGALNTGLGASVQGLGALGTGQQALNTGAGAYNSGLGAYGSALGNYGNALSSALNNASGTANLGANTAAMPSNVYTSQLNQILGALKAQQGGAGTGASTFGNILGSTGTGYQQGAGLQNTALSNYLSGTQQPYNTGVNMTNNALTGLNQATQLGNLQYQLPQQTLNALQSYLGLGQDASKLSGSLGQQGFSELSSGIGGTIAAASGLKNLIGGSASAALPLAASA